jgi:phytoene dehydrogenase-like protein
MAGRKYDVGLHAMTNYVPASAKGTPLVKLMRQLRIRREELDLAPQFGSGILMGGRRLSFTNDFAVLESEVAREFPAQIDGFRRLDAAIRAMEETALDAQAGSASEWIRTFLSDERLIDMLFIPLFYYGSARENDMDVPQFAIMWKSLYHEGFARPYIGVRQVIRVLLDKYKAAGGERKMKCGVRRILADHGRAAALELDDGSVITADHVISSAGLVETQRMCSDLTPDIGADNVGRLGYCESMAVFDRDPDADFGWKDTILFFCNAERFRYERARELVNPASGVICIPNNYEYSAGRKLDEGWLRVTALGSYDAWSALSPAAYADAKAEWLPKLLGVARAHLPPVDDAVFNRSIRATDMFTPTTVKKFTGHLGGAIYGAPTKSRDGRTHLDNLYLCGTDQGFLGITGAMLSGISMANLHVIGKQGGAA